MNVLIPAHRFDSWQKRRENGRTAPDTLAVDCGFLRPPVDVIAVAQAIGIKVLRLRKDSEYKGDGYLIIEDHRTTRIYTSGHLSEVQRRFVVAHLIGHLLLHDLRRQRVEKVLREVPRYRDDLDSRDDEKREEAEASDYAMKLLVPDYMVQAAGSGASIDHLTSWFQVSRKAMIYRLRQLYGMPR